MAFQGAGGSCGTQELLLLHVVRSVRVDSGFLENEIETDFGVLGPCLTQESDLSRFRILGNSRFPFIGAGLSPILKVSTRSTKHTSANIVRQSGLNAQTPYVELSGVLRGMEDKEILTSTYELTLDPLFHRRVDLSVVLRLVLLRSAE